MADAQTLREPLALRAGEEARDVGRAMSAGERPALVRHVVGQALSTYHDLTPGMKPVPERGKR